MGTQQALTTKQLEVLTLIYDIEEFGKKHGNVTGIKEILTQDGYMQDEEFDKYYKVLDYYGYLSVEGNVTIDGKQYLDLFVEYLQEKEKHPDIVINNSFSLIDLENLNVGLNAFVNLKEVIGIGKGLAGLIKSVMQAMKNSKH